MGNFTAIRSLCIWCTDRYVVDTDMSDKYPDTALRQGCLMESPMKFFQPGIVAMSMLLTACSSLPEGRWKETSPAADTPAMIVEIKNDRVYAYAGCNRISGTVKMVDDHLLVERLSSTLMMCHGEQGEKEEKLKQLLTNKPTVEFSQEQLILSVADESYEFTKQPNMEDGVTRMVYVGPEKVTCTGVSEMQCLQIRESEDGPWTNFYGEIEEFEYVPGNIYYLRIKEFDVAKPAADASSKRWILDGVLSVENLNVDVDDGAFNNPNIGTENPANDG